MNECAYVFQLPPKPSDQSQGSSSSSSSAPPAGAYSPYSPVVAAPSTAHLGNPPPTAPVNIGFENLSSMRALLFCHLINIILKLLYAGLC